jgi:AraC-like DNA-binding protein
MPHDMPSLFTSIAAQVSADSGMKLHNLARILGVDRHTIETAVRQVLGIRFCDFKKTKRVTRAVRLLRRRQQPLYVREIAYVLGLSPNALSRLIKSVTGESPRQIRAPRKNLQSDVRHKW